MREILLPALMLGITVFSAQATPADQCREAVINIMTSREAKGPSKSRGISVVGNQKPMISYHLNNGSGDWMTQVVEPSTMPWSLAVGNIMYTSSDNGKSWKRVRELNDPGHDPREVQRQRDATVRASRNHACGFEDIDGVRHQKLEADLAYIEMNMTTRETLWLHPETRRVVKSHIVMRTPGMETSVTQFIEYMSEIILPDPTR